MKTGSTPTITWNEAQEYFVTKPFISWENKNYLFFTVIGYNLRILLNDRELGSGYLISSLGNSLSFANDFQRYKQEMTQVNLALQNKQS